LVLAVFGLTLSLPASAALRLEVRALDGSGNNVRHPDWGKGGTEYLRVADTKYADGKGSKQGGLSARWISNRTFNDEGQNLFSENNVSQFGWVWGQFMDHVFGLRDDREFAEDHAPLKFNKKGNDVAKGQDPLEGFQNDLGAIDFFRTVAAPGTGNSRFNKREQINTVPSFIDAFNVYGGTNTRLEWLRAGPDDGNLANNSASLLLPDGYLPLTTDASRKGVPAPVMALMGPLAAPHGVDRAVVAGDVRANENIALTAMHTLFAREHNRIVDRLGRFSFLSNEDKFQIARGVVGAEMQWITYNEFLPSLGVRLPSYRGYNPNVNPGLSNEFATVGYRAHSMIHGEFEPNVPVGFYSAATLAHLKSEGVQIEDEGDGTITLVIPLSAAFGMPSMLREVGEGTLLKNLANDRQYKNDEQIDNSLRTVLFQVPKADTPDPSVCGSPVINPACFAGVADLGAIDLERARDHGIPLYNDLREAYGLPRVQRFSELTGESTSQFPSDRLINSRDPINDPNILDFVKLFDAEGNVVPLDSPDRNEDATVGIRRTTLAARLRAIYGDVDNVDAFVGMVSEPHDQGAELGDLQRAIWREQFARLRDGDRFFYASSQGQSVLSDIRQAFGIDFRQSLENLIEANTNVRVQDDVFHAAG